MSTYVDHVVLTLVDNFQCDDSEIIITPNLSIVRVDFLSDKEKKIFEGNSGIRKVHRLSSDNVDEFHVITYRTSAGQSIERTLERSNHVFRWEYNGKVPDPFKKYYDLLLTPSRWFDYLTTALRLLKPEAIGFFPEEHLYNNVPLPPEIKRSTNHHHDGYQLTKPDEVKPYILLKSEVDDVLKLTVAIEHMKLPRLLTALGRLNNQYTRAYLADRLIDAVVALEALYFDDSHHDELKYRMGLRVAVHLGGSNPDERDRLYALATTAYNLRSKIVHGALHSGSDIERFKDLRKGGWSSAENLLSDVTTLLRQSLRAILLDKTEKGFKDFHSRLDICIRRGEPFSVT